MSDYLHQVAATEARFRADVISGLHREAERLRDHRAIAADQPAAARCLEDLAAALLTAADVLAAQDGRLGQALGTEPGASAWSFDDELGFLRWPAGAGRYADADRR